MRSSFNLSILVFLSSILTSCNLLGSASSFPNRTSVAWSISLEGYGEVEQSGGLLLGMADRTTEDRLVAVDLSGKEISWKSDAVGFQGGDLVTASTEQYVYAQVIRAEGFYIYTKGGDLVQQMAFPDPYESNVSTMHPAVYGDRLYISNGRYFHAYDLTEPASPSLVWKISYDYNFKAVAVDETGNLFVSMATTKDLDVALKRLDPADGSVIWQTSTRTEKVNEQLAAYALEVEGEKLFAAALGTLQAFNKETGERLWVSDPLVCTSDGIQVVSAIELAQDTAYLAPRGGSCVFAIDLADGSMLWMHNAKVVPGAWFTYGGKPKYYNGVVYATNSFLWALDAKTGKVLSLSNIQDRLAQFTYIEEYGGEILVWGERLRAYKPVR